MSKNKEFELTELKLEDLEEIVNLTKLLNPEKPEELLRKRQKEMFQLATYKCIGFLHREKLIGLTSCWITVKLYSGKQVEVDNVIIDSRLQSKGYGKVFFGLMEDWARQNDCKTIELNTYTHNYRSHKFYFNLGYQIGGFHFQKEM